MKTKMNKYQFSFYMLAPIVWTCAGGPMQLKQP
jgi:hypothetical protein